MFVSKKLSIFANAFEAQMAESVDALVSNTSGATRAGSTPALGTEGSKREGVPGKGTPSFFFGRREGVKELRS